MLKNKQTIYIYTYIYIKLIILGLILRLFYFLCFVPYFPRSYKLLETRDHVLLVSVFP